MALIVQKFGGTSVADPEKIKSVARRVMENARAGNQMVVVLSAMAGETNRFVELAHQMQKQPDPREFDMLLSTGEQVTIALFAMAVKAAGMEAVSLLGDQVKIKTDSRHTKARIKEIDTSLIKNIIKITRLLLLRAFRG